MITAKAEGKAITLNIHSGIGGYFYDEEATEDNAVRNVNSLKRVLDAHKDASIIDIYINSPGGDVSEGIGIYNILKRTRAYKRVYIDGFACSVASVIAMAGNSIQMPKSSLQMIHNAWTYTMGNADELRKTADDLDVINSVIIEAYMSKFNGSREELQKLLDNESYLTADDCLSYGLCTKIVDDTDDTETDVSEALDTMTNMYTNRLEQLKSIKAAVRDAQSEAAKPEAVNEPEDGETADETLAAIEDEAMDAPETPTVVTLDEAREKVNEQRNALQKFFKYTAKEKMGEEK